jgi:rhodanese-related sulfurtransferase
MIKILVFLTGILILAGCDSAPTRKTDSPVVVNTLGVSEISPEEALPAIEAAYSQFIDVRTPEEFAAGHAYRARSIPLDTLQSNLDKLEKNEPVYIICRTDNRSRQAAAMLVDAGFSQAIVVKGGTEAWKAAGLPMGEPAQVANSGKLDERTQKALLAALEDERRAYATYAAVLASFPGARPFSNIVEAEKRHESFLLPLFVKYGVAVPRNEFDPAKISVPATLAEACKAGVTAEEANIALYDSLLEFVAEQDIKDVFSRLQSASRDNHLPAFSRCGGGRGGDGA